MSMLTERQAAALDAQGKLGRFLRTHRCPDCHGTGVEASWSVDYMDGDLCTSCGGSGRLAVYANNPAPSAGPAPTEERGR